MANPGTFGDLGKESKETLLRGRDFSTKPTVELNTTSSNGVKANVKISREDTALFWALLSSSSPRATALRRA